MKTYILKGNRTPIGSFQGHLSSLTAPQLGAKAIIGLLKKTNIDPKKIQQVIMGIVVQAGTGQSPARQASILAGLDESIPCSSINKVCGSGMQSIIYAINSISAQDASLIVAGGMESMSNAPHLLQQSRTGIKFGDTQLKDAILIDGLTDVYTNRPMGLCAEECVKKYNFSRVEQDQFARKSYERALNATKMGYFKDEISPLEVTNKKGVTIVEIDEEPTKVDFEKMPKLKGAFLQEGTITAANASSLNDGAAAVFIAGEEYRNQAEFEILAHAFHSQNPTWFTTAPVAAMKKCSEKAGIPLEKIDLFEINEAFSVVTMVTQKELNIPDDKVNIFGGAVSLGHPIGCSGTRIVVTLMNAMKQKNVELGMASICIGGGEALSLLIKRIK